MLLARRIPTMLVRGRGSQYLRNGTDPVAVQLTDGATLRITDLHARMRGPHIVGVDPEGRVTLVGRNVEGDGAGTAVPPFPQSEAEATPGLPSSGPQTYAARFVTAKTGLARRGADVEFWHQVDATFANAVDVCPFDDHAMIRDANGTASLVDLRDGTVTALGVKPGILGNLGDRVVACVDVQVENPNTVIEQVDAVAPTVTGVFVPSGNVRNGRSDIRVIDGTGVSRTVPWDFTGVDTASAAFLSFRHPWLRPVYFLGQWKGQAAFVGIRWFDGWYVQATGGSFAPQNGGGAQYLAYNVTRDVINDQVLILIGRDGTVTVKALGLQKRSRTVLQVWRRNATSNFYKRSGNSLTSLYMVDFPTNTEAPLRPWPTAILGDYLYGTKGSGLPGLYKWSLDNPVLGATANRGDGATNNFPFALPDAGVLVAASNDGAKPFAFSKDGGATWKPCTVEGQFPQLPGAPNLQPLFAAP